MNRHERRANAAYQKSQQVCHERIKKVAIEFAGTFYESAAHDDKFYKYYPSLDFFVAREWGRFVCHARAVMAQMLARHDVTEDEKEQIHEALCYDRALPGNVKSPWESEAIH